MRTEAIQVSSPESRIHQAKKITNKEIKQLTCVRTVLSLSDACGLEIRQFNGYLKYFEIKCSKITKK